MVPARPRVYQFGIPQVPATYSYYPDTAKFIILYDLSYLFSGLGRENRATSKAWIAMYILASPCMFSSRLQARRRVVCSAQPSLPPLALATASCLSIWCSLACCCFCGGFRAGGWLVVVDNTFWPRPLPAVARFLLAFPNIDDCTIFL